MPLHRFLAAKLLESNRGAMIVKSPPLSRHSYSSVWYAVSIGTHVCSDRRPHAAPLVKVPLEAVLPREHLLACVTPETKQAVVSSGNVLRQSMFVVERLPADPIRSLPRAMDLVTNPFEDVLVMVHDVVVRAGDLARQLIPGQGVAGVAQEAFNV